MLESLKRQGRPLSNMRLVITGDRGNFIGEQGQAGEAGGTWEPGVRVPMLFLDSSPPGELELNRPISATWAYHLALQGRLPAKQPVVAVSRPPKSRAEKGATMISAWAADGSKLTWTDGKLQTYDLRSDPNETKPSPGDAHQAAALIKNVARSMAQREDG